MTAVEQATPLVAEESAGVRMIRTLGLVSLISGILLVFVFRATEARIADNKRRALEAAVFQVMPEIPASRATFTVGPEGFTPSEGIDAPGDKVYVTYDADGRILGIAIGAAGQGYQDVIRVLFGYSPAQQQVTGFVVLESLETPGLGDRIGKEPAFLANFDGMDVQLNADQTGLAHAIETVKSGAKSQSWQVDGIAGATISSKAVGRMLNERCQQILPLIVKHLDQLEKGK